MTWGNPLTALKNRYQKTLWKMVGWGFLLSNEKGHSSEKPVDFFDVDDLYFKKRYVSVCIVYIDIYICICMWLRTIIE